LNKAVRLGTILNTALTNGKGVIEEQKDEIGDKKNLPSGSYLLNLKP
jgi:hypothetical protein